MNEFDDSEFDEYDEQNVKNDLNKRIEEDFIPRDETDEKLEIKKIFPDLDETKRIKIDKNIIKSVLNDLKTKKNLSQQKVSDIIGTNIKNLYYNYTKSMSEESFQKLEELIGKKIQHEAIEKKYLTHKKDEALAEFIGIMLGDGHLNRQLYRQQISFNGLDEKKYMLYVKGKIKSMFHIEPKERWERDKKNASGNEKGMFLYIDNKNFFNELIFHGLKSGNKVKNQVRVPNWVKKDKNFTVACLRGLFDTDGSISVVKQRSSLLIDFTNGSLPLIEDFKEMCESLNISTSPKITQRKWRNKITDNTSISYKTSIASKSQISKFISVVKPKKWEFNWERINKKLELVGSNLIDALKYYKEDDLQNYAKDALKDLE